MRFNTDQVPARNRFALFREELVARLAALEMIRHETMPFRGEFCLLGTGAVSVARLDTSPTRFLRTPELIADGDDSMCLMLCRKGRYHVVQNDHEHLIKAGGAVILDVARVAAMDAVAPHNSRWSFKVSRGRLAAASVDILGGSMPVSGEVQRLLFHYVDAAERSGLAAGSPVAAMFDDHVFDLVTYVLGAQGETREIAENRGVPYARRQAILKEIETNFSEPGLSATGVAARLGVTVRYVHHLLEETGKTFTEVVLEHRLNRTMRLLTEPRRAHQKIVEIALEAGFTDLSHFNRSFRRRFGDTPSGVRAAGRESARRPLAPQ
jgi:AraC-like DNA-binding protein